MLNAAVERSSYWRRLKAALLGGALAMYLAAPAMAAFTPSSAPLLSTAAVTPNVMLLVDDSGSMNNLIRATAFDQSLDRVQVYNCSSDFSCNRITALDMESENLFIGDLNRGGCSNLYYGFYRYSNNTVLCLKLPDPVGSGNTRYSSNYIAYLIGLVSASVNSKDYTDGSIPNDYRINVARSVSSALVTANRALRIGLATFNPPISGDPGPGGYIARTVADLQATTSTTAAQATTNYNNLISSINGLGAVANTPLAETYYEISRYFRGMSSYYNSGVSYTSPIQYRCQKNYGIVITDGLPTYDRNFPTAVGNIEPNNSTSTKLPNWDNKANDGDNLNGDGEGDTLYLDDLAKFAYDIDMRSTGNDAAGKSWDATDFPKQNLLTYTVGFTAANQMLSDAAAYGQGKYYQATDSASLTTALTAALNAISSTAGSGGGGAANNTTLTSNTFFYQTAYDPTDWRGTIGAYAISTAGVISDTPTWSTDVKVAVGTTTPTYESFNTTTNLPITLAFANFSAAQQATLNTSATSNFGATSGITGTNLVDWSKGVNKTGLKQRTVLLGDIINSPLVLASPGTQTSSSADSGYSDYLTAKAAGMVPSLVVNSNDGMTSVINANTGARLYAYMPSSVVPNLYAVADPTYINGTSHKFLDDGQITVSDAKTNSSWKTLAVGGTGAGGKTFFALQLYNQGSGSAPKALWELSAPATASTSATFNDLGYAYAKPEIAQLADGTWAAFIANGYGSNSGVAALYVVSLTDGSLIKKIVIDSTETTNGLSSVKLTVNASNVVQAAYGGDLKGRMWKFDLSAASPASWGVAFSNKPLFTAPGGATQPITAQPLLVAYPTTGYMVYFGTGKFNEVTDKATTDPQGFYAVWDSGTGAVGNYTTANLQSQSVISTFAGTGGQYVTSSANKVDYTTQKGWYLPLVYGTSMVGERVIYSAQIKLGRILFTTAKVDSTDPCASSGSGEFFELDALSGGMLSYQVIDTNGDGLINTSDTITSGLVISTGIPTLNAIIDMPTSTTNSDGSTTMTSSPTDPSEKVIIDSKGNRVIIKEKGGSGSGAGRIMWRQIQ
jgi:type IV pilus assembly protein PilY1